MIDLKEEWPGDSWNRVSVFEWDINRLGTPAHGVTSDMSIRWFSGLVGVSGRESGLEILEEELIPEGGGRGGEMNPTGTLNYHP